MGISRTVRCFDKAYQIFRAQNPDSEEIRKYHAEFLRQTNGATIRPSDKVIEEHATHIQELTRTDEEPEGNC
ncbi:MAG: hypothetical protein KJ600_03100 [Nanoarchaeota archaeon]|nr:hypothetical protein [Nanoarchaeota archaeon]MBU1103516.1 hypothetical protein [Nanoarchaeota archaeon]